MSVRWVCHVCEVGVMFVRRVCHVCEVGVSRL